MVSQDREKEAKYKIYNWLKENGFNQFAEAIEKRVIGQSELRPLLFVIYNYLEGWILRPAFTSALGSQRKTIDEKECVNLS